MDHHITELVDVVKSAFGENGMDQTSSSEIEPSRNSQLNIHPSCMRTQRTPLTPPLHPSKFPSHCQRYSDASTQAEEAVRRPSQWDQPEVQPRQPFRPV